MAGTTDVKSLLLEVDASVELLRRNLTRGDQAVGQFESETRARLDRMDRRFEQLGGGLRQLPGTIGRARAEIATLGNSVVRVESQIRASSAGIRDALFASTAAIGAAFSVNQIRDYADGYTRYTNQLKVAGLEGQALAKTQNDLFAIAQRYGVQLESVGTLYGRLSQGAKELGASQSDLLRFTNGVGAALKVQGGDAAASAGALLQLTQALGGTFVRAEEFNSINEGARPILQAVANGIERFGGSVSKLRNEVIAGTLTSREFFGGFLKGSASLEAQAAKANLTIGASFTVLNNALGKYIGEADQAGGATARVSQAIVALADNLDTIVPALTIIGVGFASRFAIGPVTASIAAIAALRAELFASNVVMLGGKTAAAAKAQAALAGAQAEVAAIEATIAARRADQAALAQTLTLIQAQRAEALQAQAAIAANKAAGFGTVGVTRSIPDAARANQDLKAQIVAKRALAAVDAELAAAETALAGAQARAGAAATASAAATTQATIAARAGAAASRLLAGGLTLIGGSVAGGAAILAIGALVAAVLYFRNQAEQTAAQLAAFAQHEREAAETSKLLASYAMSAGAQVASVGGQAATAASQVRSFAGAVGEAAAKLDELARARRRELFVRLATDKLNADNDARAAQSRFQSASGTFNAKVGYIGRDETARAAALQQYQSAQERSRNAQAGIDAAVRIPLANYIRETDRPGGRDVAGERARLARDLAIARQGGNRSQVRDLQAQQFEVNQYDKYRKSGLSVEAANAQASKDSGEFRSAGDARQARTDGAKSAREQAKAAREAAAAGRRQAAEARDAAGDARAFTAAERQANNDIASARAELSGSAEERARIEKARIESERQSKNDEIEDQAKQGRFGTGDTAKARTLELQRLNNERAGLEGQVVDARERQRIADEQLAVAQAGRQNEQDLLRAQSNIATTASERRRIELRLLDLQYDEERARLDGVIASRETSDAEKKIARERKAALDAIQAVDRKGVEEQNAGPTEQYRQRLRKATGNIHEALDEVTANGLQNLEDGLLGIVTGTESVGSAFKKMAASIIADLARIAIQKAILKAVGTSFLGFADGGEIPGLASGGSVGGVIKGPGTGKSDSILALLTGPDGGAVRVSAGETIMNERASDQFGPLLAAMNAGRLRRFANGGPIGGGSIPSLRVTPAPNLGAIRGGDRGGIVEHRVKVDVAPSPLFDTRVQQHTMAVVQASAPALVEASTANTISQLSRPRLPGGFG